MEKIKLRFFITTLSGGGAENVLVALLDKLDTNKYDITLVSVTGGVNSLSLSGDIRQRIILKKDNTLFGNIIKKVLLHFPGKLFAKLFLKGNFDIEIAYLEGFPTKVVCEINSSAKKICFVHCDVSAKNIMDKIYKRVTQCRENYLKYDRLCFVSQDAKKGFEAYAGFFRNACIVHNVIDFEKIEKMSMVPVQEEYHTGGVKLVAIGRLSKEKRMDRMINAVAQLPVPYELWIMGSGPLESELRQSVINQGLYSVKFLGYRNNPYCLLKKADLLLCSSDYEGYSTVVVEALYLGIPVLTTNCAGMNEILENGKYGVISECNDEVFRDALVKLCSDKTIYEQKKQAAVQWRSAVKPDSIGEYEMLFDSILAK